MAKIAERRGCSPLARRYWVGKGTPGAVSQLRLLCAVWALVRQLQRNPDLTRFRLNGFRGAAEMQTKNPRRRVAGSLFLKLIYVLVCPRGAVVFRCFSHFKKSLCGAKDGLTTLPAGLKSEMSSCLAVLWLGLTKGDCGLDSRLFNFRAVADSHKGALGVMPCYFGVLFIFRFRGRFRGRNRARSVLRHEAALAQIRHPPNSTLIHARKFP